MVLLRNGEVSGYGGLESILQVPRVRCPLRPGVAGERPACSQLVNVSFVWASAQKVLRKVLSVLKILTVPKVLSAAVSRRELGVAGTGKSLLSARTASFEV